MKPATLRAGCLNWQNKGPTIGPFFELAQQKQAILLTTDRDVFHTIPWLFAEHHGVIVVALKQPNRTAILLKLEWILENLPPQSFRNRVFQLRDTSWIAIPSLS